MRNFFSRVCGNFLKRIDNPYIPLEAEIDIEKNGGCRMILDFDTLREANRARLPLFKNGKGEPAHSQPDGSDWPLSQWMNAVLGELGEAANIIKKIERGDFSLAEARDILGKELADVQTYLDILAFRADIDLGLATVTKWNEVSARVNCSLRLLPYDHGYIVYNFNTDTIIGSRKSQLDK